MTEPVRTKEVAGTVQLDLFDMGGPKPWVVSITIDGSYWDYREFFTRAEADRFMDDPFRDERSPQRPEVIDLSYVALFTRVSYGRKVGRH